MFVAWVVVFSMFPISFSVFLCLFVDLLIDGSSGGLVFTMVVFLGS